MKTTAELHSSNALDAANPPGPASAVAVADGGQAPSGGTGHIGRVVAGTLVSGLVAAIALVAGPLAGASSRSYARR